MLNKLLTSSGKEEKDRVRTRKQEQLEKNRTTIKY